MDADTSPAATETTSTDDGESAAPDTSREARNATRAARLKGGGAAPAAPRPGGPTKPIGTPVANDDDGESADLGLDDEDAEALEGAGEPGEETIRIGDLDVPLSALSSLPDDVLKRIKRKIKSSGKELEISLADALESVPKAEGWQRRMWEARQKEQGLEKIAQQMGTDPVGAYAALHGVSRSQAMDALTAKYMAELEQERMTPEERAKADKQADLERRARRADELEKQERDRAMQAETDNQRRVFVGHTKTALEGAGLASSKRNVQQVALLVDRMMRDGVIKGAPTADDFAEAAKDLAKEIDEERGGWLPEDAEGDALIEKIGIAKARKIAQAMAKRVRKGAPVVERKREPGAAPRTKPADSWEEWQARANRRQGIRT